MITSALAVAALGAAGIYLVLQRGMMRILIGFLLLQHAVNLLIIAVRAPARWEAPVRPLEVADMSDPLGQAFVLTAIVVGLASVAIWLALAFRSRRLRARDAEEDDDLERPDAGNEGRSR